MSGVVIIPGAGTITARQQGEKLFGVVNITVKGQASTESTPVDVFSLALTLEITYTLKDRVPMPKAMLKLFGETNVIYNAWPYVRAVLQGATLDMGLAPIIAPVLRRL